MRSDETQLILKNSVDKNTKNHWALIPPAATGAIILLLLLIININFVYIEIFIS